METEKGWDRRLRILKEKIDDLEACIAGRSSSKRWQDINTELQKAKLSLSALNEKAENNTPPDSRRYHRISSRDFQ